MTNIQTTENSTSKQSYGSRLPLLVSGLVLETGASAQLMSLRMYLLRQEEARWLMHRSIHLLVLAPGAPDSWLRPSGTWGPVAPASCRCGCFSFSSQFANDFSWLGILTLRQTFMAWSKNYGKVGIANGIYQKSKRWKTLAGCQIDLTWS